MGLKSAIDKALAKEKRLAPIRTKNTNRTKYRNKRTKVDGITFMSKGEANRYLILKELQEAGKIDRLQLQPAFPIIIKGKKVCKVIADFAYRDLLTMQVVVEDFKGVDTPVSRLKRKMVEADYGIKIHVVRSSKHRAIRGAI